MAKPIIMAVDDDPNVLRAIEVDLRRHYGHDYRIVRAESGAVALDSLHELKQRNAAVALFLVDQRMPGMSGVELLAEAIPLFPDAKRMLLTAYADTLAAVQAINTARVDYYSMKPWDPPEQNLYPVVDDLLDDWKARFHSPYEGTQVVGLRWAADSHLVKDFLARQEVPFRWFDVDTAEGQRLLAGEGEESPRLPVILFPDGTRLIEPTIPQIAEKLGLRMKADREFYDLIIVGGGPSGLAAAVYGASEGLRTALIERDVPGGQAGTSSRIENYLGFPSGLSGGDLARRAVAQAERFGVEILSPQVVTAVRIADPYRYVLLGDGIEIACHVLLIATGVQYRTLDVPGIERLTGTGVYYGAAMTEALSCVGDDVFIVGGANSAGQAAMYFSRYARSVHILVRGSSLEAGMSQYLIEEIKERPNIVIHLNSEVVEARGDVRLESLVLANRTTGALETVQAAALFIFIGASPRTNWLDGVVERDPQGFILSGPDLPREGQRPRGWTVDRDPFLLESSVPGIFVVGDVRCRSVKRVASAVGEGAMAVMFMHQYLGNI